MSGTCKQAGARIAVTMKESEYDLWQLKSHPLAVAAPDLTRDQVTFLTTGIWKGK